MSVVLIYKFARRPRADGHSKATNFPTINPTSNQTNAMNYRDIMGQTAMTRRDWTKRP